MVDSPHPARYNHSKNLKPSQLGALFLASTALTLQGADPASFKVGGLTFERPEKFQWEQITPGMRAAQLKVPGQDGKAGEIVFFNFPAGVGGGVQANIDRWLGMFREPKDQIKAKTEKIKKGAATITYVQAEGTYMSGMPGGPKTAEPGTMLQGAIIETPQSNVFVRMTGPIQLMQQSQKDFRTMIESPFK